jgi:predicted DNA-binding protein YlxM (UPF0122 family)
MGEKYYSILEFAELVNVSVQSIYKRLKRDDNIIHKYVKIKNGKKVISGEAVEIYKKDEYEYEDITEPEETEETEEKENTYNQIIEIYQKQIELLTAEIEVKNRQIEELTAQLKASSDRETNYQQLLNQQQQLNGIDKQRVLLLEEQTQAEKKKKGVLGIFKRKKENNSEYKGE